MIVYCVVQVSVSVMGAFIVTENCVFGPEYDPEPDPVIVLIHQVCPRFNFTDHGKGALAE